MDIFILEYRRRRHQCLAMASHMKKGKKVSNRSIAKIIEKSRGTIHIYSFYSHWMLIGNKIMEPMNHKLQNLAIKWKRTHIPVSLVSDRLVCVYFWLHVILHKCAMRVNILSMFWLGNGSKQRNKWKLLLFVGDFLGFITTKRQTNAIRVVR